MFGISFRGAKFLCSLWPRMRSCLNVAIRLAKEHLSSITFVVFDFDGVFTDNSVWIDQDSHESIRCNRADGFGVDLLRAAHRKGILNVELYILSTETNPVVK